MKEVTMQEVVLPAFLDARTLLFLGGVIVLLVVIFVGVRLYDMRQARQQRCTDHQRSEQKRKYREWYKKTGTAGLVRHINSKRRLESKKDESDNQSE